MLRKLLVLTCMFAVAAFAVENVQRVPQGVEAVPVHQVLRSGDEEVVVRGTGNANVFMVEGEQAGTTTYDYQQNGAMGNRVAIDADGNAHICWMESQEDDFADRNVHYNFWEKATEGFVWPPGIKVSGSLRAGYTTGGVMPDGRAVIAFHEASGNDTWAAVVVDAAQGAGAFPTPVRPDGSIQVIWPHMVVGSNGTIHVAGHINDTSALGDVIYYSRSTDGGVTFSPWQQVTNDGGDDPAIAVSKDGNRICIAFMSQIPVNSGGKDFACGHINYVESTNGGTSWGTRHKITEDRYSAQVINTDTLMFLFANNRCVDVAYDDAGKVHILYTEGWHQWNDGAYYYPKMWGRTIYWNEASGFSCPTANFPMFHSISTEGDTLWEFDSLGMWGVGTAVGEEHGGQYGPQIAIWGSNIIATWGGQWDSLDLSGGGTVNGDLYASVTTDGGANWSPLEDYDSTMIGTVWQHVTNITNTHAPGAGVGSCPDEDYHTVWPWVDTDNVLHITYIKDLFAGSVISNEDCPSYGITTNSPSMYLAYKGSGSGIKVGKLIGIEEKPVLEPSNVELAGSIFVGAVNFHVTNPLNGATLKIYDASGSLVETLKANSSNVTWNAEGVAPGVYFYSFTSPTATSTGKLVLVR